MFSSKIKALFKGASGDSFLLIFVRVITLFSSILITRILSGHFSVHDYGTYSQILLLSTTITNLTILGMTDGINYFFCKESNLQKRDAYVGTIFSLQYIISGLATIVVLACAVPISDYFKNDDIKNLIIFAAILPLFQNLISLLQVMFIAIGKAKHIAVRNFLVSVFKLLAILLACYCFNNIAVVLICQVLTEIAQVIYFTISLKKSNCRVQLRNFDKSLIKPILAYCLPMAMAVTVKSLNTDCDKYIISAFTDTETLAIYTNASKQLPFYIITTAFCTVLVPYITRYIVQKDYATAQKVYKAFLELSYITTAALAIGAICVAPELMNFLYTEKYISGLPVFIIYILVDILFIFNLTLVLSAAGKTKTIMFIAIGTFVSKMALSLALYFAMGVIGLAIATLIVTIGQSIAILAFGAKELKTHILNLFSKRYLCLFVIELLVMGVLTVALRGWLIHVGLPGMLVLCVCYGFFVCPILILNLKRLKQNISIINGCKLQK